jgi:hypothetical protein
MSYRDLSYTGNADAGRTKLPTQRARHQLRHQAGQYFHAQDESLGADSLMAGQEQERRFERMMSLVHHWLLPRNFHARYCRMSSRTLQRDCEECPSLRESIGLNERREMELRQHCGFAGITVGQ